MVFVGAGGRGEAARADRVSYWLASTPQPSSLQQDLPERADVVVVGAGIVGLSAAHLLCQAGSSVVVLEADEVATGVSGYTSAKLTVGHGLAYSRLESAFDADASRLYAESQSAALELVRMLCSDHSIECDLETVPNFVFADSADDLDQIHQEIEAASRAGLPASFADPAEIPVPSEGAVRLDGQAQFHVRKYLLALAALVAERGTLVEKARVTEITAQPKGGHRVSVGDATVDAAAVVVATHYPIVQQGFFVPRIHPRRSYVVAARLQGPPPEGMYINVSPPARSFRTTPLPDGSPLLLVGGEGHRVGQEDDTEERYATLERYMREHFDVAKTEYRWSTQDLHPIDGLPYIGEVEDHPGLFVATGFAGWGMTNGTLAGMLLADAIQGAAAKPWAALYDLDRRHVIASASRFLKENTNVAARQIGGHYVPLNADATERIGAGEGAVISIEGEELAVSRDTSGELHAVKAACTHMGCVVSWNKAESSWDCPCHGSRFAADGRILHGPAMQPLESVPLPPPTDIEREN